MKYELLEFLRSSSRLPQSRDCMCYCQKKEKRLNVSLKMRLIGEAQETKDHGPE